MNTNSGIEVYNGGADIYLAPAVNVQLALESYQAKKDFIDNVLKEGTDYGPIPGTDKPALKKPGAEKMVNLFGLVPVFEDVETVEDWTGANHGGEPFFYYRQKCSLSRRGILAGSADGSCNSFEKKYRYRWVGETEVPSNLDKSKLKTRGGRVSEFDFAIERAETSGQYGKPAEYWKRFKDAIETGTATRTTRKTKTGKQMDAWEIDSTLYSVPNDDVAEQVNTILKMAQKRALVAAVLIVTGVSDYFTQDVDDFIEGEYTFDPGAVGTPARPTTTQDNGKTNGKAKVEQSAPIPEMVNPNGEEAANQAADELNAESNGNRPAEPAPAKRKGNASPTAFWSKFRELADKKKVTQEQASAIAVKYGNADWPAALQELEQTYGA